MKQRNKKNKEKYVKVELGGRNARNEEKIKKTERNCGALLNLTLLSV